LFPEFVKGISQTEAAIEFIIDESCCRQCQRWVEKLWQGAVDKDQRLFLIQREEHWF